jgi:hypothetical protein
MLPRDIQEALDDYDRRAANGELQFTHDGEFAAMPPDYMGGWIQSQLALHVSVFDSEPTDTTEA